MQITLTVVSGPHTGQVFTFTGHDRFLVGRSVKAHFRLLPSKEKDLRVSRLHFLVEVNPPLCRLHDVGSQNGTFVNGQRVGSADLHSGDEIRAGHTVLRVDLLTPGEEPTGAWSAVFDLPTVRPEPAAPGLPQLPKARGSRSENGCALCGTPLSPGSRTLCEGCRTRSSAQPQPIPGYLLLSELGRGGMGVVYLGMRVSDDALLAVKTILPAATPRPGQVERFLREASILRDLDHPHIVPFRELGATGEHLFFATDYIPGTDAACLVHEKGRLGVRFAVRLINQVLLALEYAHGRGFVHRDIKPANVLLRSGEKRVALLADFGLARVYQASQLSGLTLANDLGGTVGFLPPEQITHFRDAQPASDQYATAATLYNLLTGCYPHDRSGSFAEQLDRILKEEPVPIGTRRNDLPQELAAVIHRALATKPERRFPGVGRFRRALLPFAK